MLSTYKVNSSVYLDEASILRGQSNSAWMIQFNGQSQVKSRLNVQGLKSAAAQFKVKLKAHSDGHSWLQKMHPSEADACCKLE